MRSRHGRITILQHDLARSAARSTAFRVVACVVLASTIAGCILYGGVRGPERVPTVIGVIADVEPRGASGQALTLEDGRIVTIPPGAELVGRSSGPEPGNLLFANPDDGEPWYIAMRPRRHWPSIELCFQLGTGYAEERNGKIVTREGLVIEKARDYVPGGAERDGRYEDPRGIAFCLDEEGRALGSTAHRAGDLRNSCSTAELCRPGGGV